MKATPNLNFTTVDPTKDSLKIFVTMLRSVYQHLTDIINGKIGFGDGTNHDNIDGSWINVVTPVAPNTDFTVNHNLGRLPVGYWIMVKDRAVDVYTGSVAATKTALTLRATVASAVIRLFIIGLLLGLFAARSEAQGTNHTNIALASVRTNVGTVVQPVVNAVVTVCNGSTLPAAGSACTGLASIFSNKALSSALSNPTNADVNGNYTFWVSPGSYVVSVAGVGFVTYSYAITASCDPTGLCTITGNLTVSGMGTFTGPLNALYTNAIRNICNKSGVSAGWAGADVSVWIANAEADLPSTGGVLDATSCGGSQTISQEIDVGNSAQMPVKLLLPNTGPFGGAWVSNQTGGTAYVLKVFSRSMAIGPGTGEGQAFVIAAGATANVDTVCGNDPSGNGTYPRMEGFSCLAQTGATVAKAVLHISNFADETYVGHMTAYTTSANAHKACWFHNGGIASFETINCETSGAPSGSGAVPCTFGNGSTDSLTANHFKQISCVHPSIGSNAVVVQQFDGGSQGNVFESIYMEECSIAAGCVYSQDTTTPYISIQAFTTPQAADLFINPICNADIAASTRYCADIASTGRATFVNLRGSNVSSNMINDHNSGAQPVQKSPTSTVNYTTEDFYAPNIQMYNSAATWKLFPVGSGFNVQQIVPSSFAWQFGAGGSTVTFTNSATGGRSYNFPDVSIANVADRGTLTLKKGSGAGNYTTASTTYVVVDSTNLCNTVTIPTGWKLGIQVNGAIGTATGAVLANLALTDNAACGTTNAGILVETTETTTAPSVLQPVSLGWVINGDGASHNVALQFKTSAGADSATLLNASATQLPTMVFTLMPSN